MNQEILNRAVNIATRNALGGTPVEQVIWIPPRSATENPRGMFLTIFPDDKTLSATEIMPWDH